MSYKYSDKIFSGSTKQSRFHVVTKFEYTSSGGIFVPKSAEQIYPSKDGGRARAVRRAKLENSEMNVHFSKDEFTFKKFGLNNGSRIRDSLKNKLYFYIDGALTESLPGPHDNTHSSFSFFRVVMIVIGFAFIVLGLILRVLKNRNVNMSGRS